MIRLDKSRVGERERGRVGEGAGVRAGELNIFILDVQVF